ncbi:Glycerate kinase [Lucilia cuprina]|uniref:Glycerate kinase n=1 Tax=Lucilia cuprina TaxID=7375 RepID=A0A0L0C8V4_LUCCU|nr:Glycerate kinase [Lucilia cuprina]KNC28706.1 Glycerate kinase [Lucilia cuprina]
MTGHLKHLHNLKNIFLKSVEAVRPKNLLSAGNNYNLEPRLEANKICIQVQGKYVDITNKKCHVVGFGKAVLGMAVQLERSLGEFLHQGVLSIPKGSRQQFEGIKEMTLRSNSLIQIYEGAENNQPDENALRAAKEIKRLAESMTPEDVLFVLISGGGSALLPLPKATLKLEDKMQLIKRLSNCGASIQEMNIVRIALSDIKGGKLAMAAAQAHAVISFVISDIVGDPVDLIASGPTWCTQTKHLKAKEILEKFNLWQDLDEHIKQLLLMENKVETQPLKNNSIYVVGDNRVATAAAVHESLKLNYNPFIASTTIQGEISSLVTQYCDFINNIYDFKDRLIDEQELSKKFPFDSRTFQHFLKTLIMCEKSQKPLLLIMAGEPTVKVSGSGVGGRNQELALRLSQEFHQQPRLKNVCFLSAGTDGIDGPCSAAGAMGSSQIVLDYLADGSKTLQNFKEFITNNDSYNFYKNLKQGDYHVITGHTGTNVMDLHLLLVL